MRRIIPILFVFAASAPAAIAQEGGVNCNAVYENIVQSHPIDLDSCVATPANYQLDQCVKPTTPISNRPTSHMILAIDASGSMAGRIGGETKMAAAKREALAFLRDIPREINVGLVVYGHRGNNQESGKAESCGASELVHSFDAGRDKLEASIQALSPTGWTPLGGVLEYAATVVATLPTPRQGDLAPVVYLISDGEETCGGDPVAAAGALFGAGVKTVVNTIGFNVDSETAAQLMAIANAAGGTYFPADDVAALRRQFNAIKDAEGQLARYQNCVNLNAGKIASVYHNARISIAGCYQRNDPTARQVAVIHAMNRAVKNNQPEAICASELTARATAEAKPYRSWFSDNNRHMTDEPLRLIDEYYRAMKLD